MYIVLGVTIVTLFMFLRPIDTDDTSHTVKAIAMQGVYQRMSSDVPIPFQQLKDISIENIEVFFSSEENSKFNKINYYC